jgi:hypothetical protein
VLVGWYCRLPDACSFYNPSGVEVPVQHAGRRSDSVLRVGNCLWTCLVCSGTWPVRLPLSASEDWPFRIWPAWRNMSSAHFVRTAPAVGIKLFVSHR